MFEWRHGRWAAAATQWVQRSEQVGTINPETLVRISTKTAGTKKKRRARQVDMCCACCRASGLQATHTPNTHTHATTRMSGMGSPHWVCAGGNAGRQKNQLGSINTTSTRTGDRLRGTGRKRFHHRRQAAVLWHFFDVLPNHSVEFLCQSSVLSTWRDPAMPPLFSRRLQRRDCICPVASPWLLWQNMSSPRWLLCSRKRGGNQPGKRIRLHHDRDEDPPDASSTWK
jgi:hypothetical protein